MFALAWGVRQKGTCNHRSRYNEQDLLSALYQANWRGYNTDQVGNKMAWMTMFQQCIDRVGEWKETRFVLSV